MNHSAVVAYHMGQAIDALEKAMYHSFRPHPDKHIRIMSLRNQVIAERHEKESIRTTRDDASRTCPKCGQQFSDKLYVCPKCGG